MVRKVRAGNQREQGSHSHFLERELCERSVCVCVCGHNGNWSGTAALGGSEVQGPAHVIGIQWQPLDSVPKHENLWKTCTLCMCIHIFPTIEPLSRTLISH